MSNLDSYKIFIGNETWENYTLQSNFLENLKFNIASKTRSLRVILAEFSTERCREFSYHLSTDIPLRR